MLEKAEYTDSDEVKKTEVTSISHLHLEIYCDRLYHLHGSSLLKENNRDLLGINIFILSVLANLHLSILKELAEDISVSQMFIFNKS